MAMTANERPSWLPPDRPLLPDSEDLAAAYRQLVGEPQAAEAPRVRVARRAPTKRPARPRRQPRARRVAPPQQPAAVPVAAVTMAPAPRPLLQAAPAAPPRTVPAQTVGRLTVPTALPFADAVQGLIVSPKRVVIVFDDPQAWGL